MIHHEHKHVIATETVEPDPVIRAYTKLWVEVVLRASLEASKQRKRRYRRFGVNDTHSVNAYAFFCSKHFDIVADFLSIDADEVRKRLVPEEFKQKRALPIRATALGEIADVA